MVKLGLVGQNEKIRVGRSEKNVFNDFFMVLTVLNKLEIHIFLWTNLGYLLLLRLCVLTMKIHKTHYVIAFLARFEQFVLNKRTKWVHARLIALKK